MKMNKGLLVLASLLLVSCNPGHVDAAVPCINGKAFLGISVEWRRESDRAKISLEKNRTNFSFSMQVVPHWESSSEKQTYASDCGHFEFVDSTGDTVSFTNNQDFSSRAPSYSFEGARDIIVIFDTEFQVLLETAEQVDFLVCGQLFHGPSSFRNY